MREIFSNLGVFRQNYVKIAHLRKSFFTVLLSFFKSFFLRLGICQFVNLNSAKFSNVVTHINEIKSRENFFS